VNAVLPALTERLVSAVSNDPSTSGRRPWRLLVHDPGRGDGDPKFILCTVAAPGDVRPASSLATVDEVTTA
jgi:hypothetical protein